MGTRHTKEDAQMTQELDGMRVAFLVANEGIEQVELTKPWAAVKDAGGHPELIAPEAGTAQAVNHLEPAYTFNVDVTTVKASACESTRRALPGPLGI
jgi:protease I